MSITSIQYRAVQNLANYATATGINHSRSVGEAATEAGGLAACSGGWWLWKNRKDLSGAFNNLKQTQATNTLIMKEATKGGKTIGNIYRGASEITAKAELESLVAAGKDAKASAKAIETAAKAEKALAGAGKTGYSAALKAVEGRNFWTKAIKGFKGSGGAGMAIFEMGIGTFTEIIPAFKLGTKQGFKQIGKTGVKAAAVGVGWWAGSVVGAKAGVAIGAAIGSVFPGVGNAVGGAVGAVVGFLGGCLGSWLCGKAAEKVVGPSEVEKAEQEAATQTAEQVAQTGEGADDVAAAAYQKLVQSYIANNGQLSEEDIKAKESLENLYNMKLDLAKEAQQVQAQMAAEESAQDASQSAAQAQTVVSQGAQRNPAQSASQTQIQAQEQAEAEAEEKTKAEAEAKAKAEAEAKAKAEAEAKAKKAKQQPLSYLFGSLTAQSDAYYGYTLPMYTSYTGARV